MNGRPDFQRSQILRQQCSRVLSGKSVHDIVGALEMLIADTLLGLPGQTEAIAQSGADADAADNRPVLPEERSDGEG